MEQKSIYYISEAAKKVQVESHVLRYWEEELQLPIKRNEMGHRYYTEQDVRKLQEIKHLKEQGLQLKAIRTILFKAPAGIGGSIPERITGSIAENTSEGVSGDSAGGAEKSSSESWEGASGTDGGNGPENVEAVGNGKNREVNQTEMEKDRLMDMVRERVEEKTEELAMNKAHRYVVALSKDQEAPMEVKREITDSEDTERTRKAARLQYLLQHMITEAVRSANRELCTEVKDSILKELDYQFRLQEERDEERWKQEEEHYRRIDEMIRERHKPRERLGKGRKKQ